MKGTSENAALNTANPHSLAERILIVEDDSYIAYEVADQIKGFGYCAIGPVSTGEEAVSILSLIHI